MAEPRRGSQRASASRGVRSATQNAAGAARDGGRLVRALAEANTEMWVGTTRVLGNLLADLTESVLGRGGRSDDEDDLDHEDNSDEPAAGRRSRDFTDDVGRETRSQVRDLSNSLADAVEDSARVVSRSAERFSNVYQAADRSPEGREDAKVAHDEHAHKAAADKKHAEKKAP